MKIKTIITSLTLAVASAILLPPQTCSAGAFNGTGVGPISDCTNSVPGSFNDTIPLVVSFNVTNVQGSVQSIALSITMQHEWLGDLDVQLTSPSGAGFAGTNFIIFSRVEGPPGGTEGYGCGLDLNGTYVFNDAATNTLRNISDQMAVTYSLAYGSGLDYTNVIPGGAYRTSSPGPFNDAPTGFATNSGFIGLSPARANGTWTLTFRDGSNGDVGAVSAATLFLNTTVAFTTLTASNGNVQLNLSGPIGQSFRVWSSTNVSAPFPASWSIVSTNTFDLNGNASVTNDTSLPSCFFQASVP